MNNSQLKGVYLHGYQGFVTDEKKEFLNQIGNIYAPTIDYDTDYTILHRLYEQFRNEKLDFVSGTSLGGILSYHLALLLNVPCLLLNPAVTAMNQIESFIPQEALSKLPQKEVTVLVGMKDEVIEPKFQLSFFESINKQTNNIRILINDNLEHLVPLENFVDAFKIFLKKP